MCAATLNGNHRGPHVNDLLTQKAGCFRFATIWFMEEIHRQPRHVIEIQVLADAAVRRLSIWRNGDCSFNAATQKVVEEGASTGRLQTRASGSCRRCAKAMLISAAMVRCAVPVLPKQQFYYEIDYLRPELRLQRHHGTLCQVESVDSYA